MFVMEDLLNHSPSLLISIRLIAQWIVLLKSYYGFKYFSIDHHLQLLFLLFFITSSITSIMYYYINSRYFWAVKKLYSIVLNRRFMENSWWIILKSQINETMNKKVCRCFYGSGEVEHSIKTTLCLYCSGFPFFVLICSTIMHDERDVQTKVPEIWFKKIRTKKNWSLGYHLRVDLELTLLVSSNHIMSGIG